MRTASRLCWVLAAAPACGAPPEACDTHGPASDCWAPDPGVAGPYAVGVTTLELVDDSRTEPDGSPRPLKVEVWYPAVAASRSAPRDVYSFEREAPPDLQATFAGSGIDLPAQDAARDAEPERSGGPY